MEPPPNWPTPEPGQVQVMLLGTYHMDNPGLDAHNVEADDVLASDRQAELRKLVGRLAEWDPDRVAVERPHEREEDVNQIYRAYRDGEYAYDEAVQLDSPAGGRDDPTSECRSEVVQVGFRLADRLGHETVHTVDSRPEMEEGQPIPDWSIETDPQDAPYPAPDVEGVAMNQQSRLAENTLIEYHRFKNTEEQLVPPDQAMYQYALDDWDAEEYAGVAALSLWSERNLRMVQNVWNAAESGDRVLFLVGAGHVPPLRRQLATAPMTCPVSPLPLLQPR